MPTQERVLSGRSRARSGPASARRPPPSIQRLVSDVIVVDLGCFPHWNEISIEALLERYRPDVLYGFDPWPGLKPGENDVEGARVILDRRAAWIEDGEIEFAHVRGLRGWDSTVMRAKNSRGEWSGAGEIVRVPCFDFSAWLRGLPERPIVKFDVEGAEFPILEHMVEDGTDVLVAEALVEWHDVHMPDFAERKATLLSELRCPVATWEDPRTTLWSAPRGLWRSRRALGAR
jgi:FkbM family methyltransferase